MCDTDLLLCLFWGRVCRLRVLGLPVHSGAFFNVLSRLCLSSAGHRAVRKTREVCAEERLVLCLQAQHLLRRSRVYYFYLLTSKGNLKTTYQKAVESW